MIYANVTLHEHERETWLDGIRILRGLFYYPGNRMLK